MAVDLSTVVTNDQKTIRDLISSTLMLIMEDRSASEMLKQRVAGLLTGDGNLIDNMVSVGNLEKDYVMLQSNSSKQLIELLKVIAKLTEPDKAVVGMNGNSNSNDEGNVTSIDDLHKLAELIDEGRIDIDEELSEFEEAKKRLNSSGGMAGKIMSI